MIFTRIRRSIPTAFAAAVTVALLGCQAAQVPQKYVPTGVEPVNITVTFDAATKTIGVAPDPAHLWEEKNYPVWILVDVPTGSKLAVDFKGGSPFAEAGSFPPGAKGVAAMAASEKSGSVVRFGPPRRGTAGKKYKYDVTLTFPDGTTARVDPDIEVWP
jgi:hypothetical protein